MPPPRNITILGGGLTGLASAYQLSRSLPASSRITLLESTDRIGGWVQSKRHAIGFLDGTGQTVEGEVVCEQGPRSIRPKGSRGAAGMLRLIRDLDLLDSMYPISKTHPSAKNRFILDQSTSKPELSKLTLNPFRSRQPLLRGILSEPFRRNQAEADDESVDTFLRRRFGGAIADLASAGMHGIYASSPTQLSARAVLGGLYEGEREYGSVLLGMLRRRWRSEVRDEKAEVVREWEEMGELGKRREEWSMYGLRGGLQTLTDGLSGALKGRGVDVRLGDKVTGLAVNGDQVKVTTTQTTHSTDHLISALPPPLLSSLFPSNTSLPHLKHNPSTSVGVVNLVFPLPPTSIHPDGFGYLIPRPAIPGGNPENILGVVFDSTALPGLDSPSVEGKITKLTVMMGGPYWSTYPSSPTNPEPAPRPTSADQLLEPALNHLRKIFPILQSVEPIVAAPHLHLDCIPTYLPGHHTRLRELDRAIRKGPWARKLTLAGNGFGGVGVNDCIWSVEGIVEGLMEGRTVTGLERWAEIEQDVTAASSGLTS